MACSKRTDGEPSSEALHSPLVAHVVIRYTRCRAVTTGPNTRVEVFVLGRLDVFLKTREPQSYFAGAPTSVWYRLYLLDTHFFFMLPLPSTMALYKRSRNPYTPFKFDMCFSPTDHAEGHYRPSWELVGPAMRFWV